MAGELIHLNDLDALIARIFFLTSQFPNITSYCDTRICTHKEKAIFGKKGRGGELF